MSRSEEITNQITQKTTNKQMPTTIKGMLSDNRFIRQIQAALPNHMTPDRMARIAMTEIRKNPLLEQCDPLSLFGVVIQSAQLGLEIGAGLGHSYIIPFNNRKKGTVEIQFIIGYRGMIDLARRSGQILSIQSHAIHENDKFEFSYGLNECLHHEPAKGNKGEFIGAYALAKLKDGGHQFEVMYKEDIDAIRGRSKGGQYGPWSTDYDQMACKTVMRRLFKYLPVSVEMQKAVTIDEQGEYENNDNYNYKSVFEDSNVFESEIDKPELINTQTGEVK